MVYPLSYLWIVAALIRRATEVWATIHWMKRRQLCVVCDWYLLLVKNFWALHHQSNRCYASTCCIERTVDLLGAPYLPDVVFLDCLLGKCEPFLVEPFGFVANKIVWFDVKQDLSSIVAQVFPSLFRWHLLIIVVVAHFVLLVWCLQVELICSHLSRVSLSLSTERNAES